MIMVMVKTIMIVSELILFQIEPPGLTPEGKMSDPVSKLSIHWQQR